jgi:tetratricopeptide (TPR) repeat protein
MKNLPFLLLVMILSSTHAGDDDILPVVPEGAQAVSLLGEPLRSPDPGQAFLDQLTQARADLDSGPDNADKIIWYGRRMAYTGNYRQAIRIFTEGIAKHPDDARMYRHRGHRYISIRDFDRAIQDLETASRLIEGTANEIEPDGLPNALNIPVSSLHGNIWYHLGLAYYLKQDWDNAFRAFQAGFDTGRNDDNIVSMTHWRYMILRRSGKPAEAAAVLDDIRADMNVIENTVYHRLCLFYKGEISIDEFTTDGSDTATDSAAAYGIANWYFYNADFEEAERRLREHLKSDSWAAFGYIAAEADIRALSEVN